MLSWLQHPWASEPASSSQIAPHSPRPRQKEKQGHVIKHVMKHVGGSFYMGESPSNRWMVYFMEFFPFSAGWWLLTGPPILGNLHVMNWKVTRTASRNWTARPFPYFEVDAERQNRSNAEHAILFEADWKAKLRWWESYGIYIYIFEY